MIMLSLVLSCAVGQKASKSSDLPDKEKKWFKEARQESQKKNWDKALELYQKILKNKPDYVDAYLLQGGIYYNKKDFNKAAELFQQAIDTDPEHNPEAYYSLFLSHIEQEKYNEGLSALDDYIFRVNEGNKKYDRALEQKEKYTFIREQKLNPVPFSPEPMGDAINSSYSEYVPVFTADGGEMIFTRRINQQEDLMISFFGDSTFSEATLITDLNTLDNEGVHTISADGNTLIFTACNRRNGFGSCDLMYSYRTEKGWVEPYYMSNKINNTGWDSQPSLSADGNTLYFSTRRRGNIGGADIYVVRKDKDGKWGFPENLGGKVNTLGNDETPFIHHDGVTLYFRSDGHVGMGGFDLFKTVYDPEIDEWSIPVNLGYPINSEDDEGGLFVSLDGETAYFATDKGKDNTDIYSFELYPEIRPKLVTYVSGKILNAETLNPLNAEIILEHLGDSTLINYQSDAEGNFLITLPIGVHYGLSVEKEGYMFYSENIRLDSVRNITEAFQMDIKLSPIPEEITEVEEPIILKNIFFDTGSSVLLEKSNSELDRLASLLKENSNAHIAITGHTDDIGEVKDNLELSIARAQSVKTALIARGISESRITSDGRGETEPIDTNDTEEGRSNNRRTAFTLISP